MSSKGLVNTTQYEQEYIIEFGKSLRDLRQSIAKKSLRIFSYETDVPCATLSRIENGLRIPNIVILKRIAAGLDWSLAELIDKIENNINDNVKHFEI